MGAGLCYRKCTTIFTDNALCHCGCFYPGTSGKRNDSCSVARVASGNRKSTLSIIVARECIRIFRIYTALRPSLIPYTCVKYYSIILAEREQPADDNYYCAFFLFFLPALTVVV